MPVLSLTLTESDEEVFDGIPEYVEFSTNIPATVFYTFDSSTPTDESTIAIGSVSMPLNGVTFYLKAIAVAGSEESDVLSVEYKTTQDRSGLIGRSGVNILPYGEAPIDHLAYDSDGELAKESIIELQDLELLASTTNRRGEEISGDSTLDFVNFQKRDITRTETIVSTANSAMFDPKAKVIYIDGLLSFEENDIRIFNRPHNTMEPTSKFYTEHQNTLDQSGLITGNLGRYMVNPRTGVIVFYYYESRENRWLISKQQLNGDASTRFDANPDGPGAGRFVIRWVEDRAMSRLY